MGNAQLRVNTSAVDPGNTEFGRASVTRSTGISYNAVWASDSKIHIFEVSADHLTVTERILITPSGAEVPQRISLAWNALDSSLGIAYQTSTTALNNRVRYAKVNTTTWAAPTWEDVTGLAGATSQYSNFDMDISDTGLVVVAVVLVDRASAAALQVYSKATTGGAWVQTSLINLYGGHAGTMAGEAVSVACLGVTGGIRDYVAAASASTFSNPAKIFTGRITETTAAQQTALTLRTSLMTAPFTGTDAQSTTTKFVHYKLFRNSGSTYEFAGMSRSTKTLHYHKGTFNAGTWANVIPEQTFTYSNKTWTSMGISFGVGLNSVGPTWYVKDNSGVVWAKAGSVSGTTFVWTGGEGRIFPGLATQTVSTISDNSAPFPTVTDQDIVITVNDSVAGTVTTYDSYAGLPVTMPGGNTGILSLQPSPGAVNVLGNPTLVAVVDTDLKYGPGPYMMEFQFAADSGFTTSLQTYRQPTTKATYVDGTDTPGVSVTISDTMPVTLAKSVWFYRARLVDQWGNVGGWFSGGSFTVGHPPTAVPTTPLSGSYNWNAGNITFTWNFTDPSPGDTQSAYQVQIISPPTGGVLVDSGKVLSTQQSYTPATLAGSFKDIPLSWQVKVWDSQDTPGNYSTPQQFQLTDLPAVPVSVPAPNAVLTTGVPTYTFAPTTGGFSPPRRIAGYQVVITSASSIVYASPMIPVDLASGTTINYKQPRNLLKNNQSYTLQIYVIDNAGLSGASSPIPFTTAWAVPATPGTVTVDITAYDLEGAGYNLIQWPDTGRATGFTHWTVYRQDDLIDPNTGSVIQAGTPKPIYDDYDTGSGYAYKDFVAPSNQYQSIYSVTQWQNVGGQDIESLMSSAAAVKSVSQAYWLINQDVDTNSAATMRLSIVSDDSFNEEQEEAEFTVVGRGRVVNRGQYLGPKGTITAKLRNTGITTARQKRLNLMSILEQTGELLLRNPFGDVWSVNMSNVGVSRIAGVGAMEFCDVTVPYSEVS